MFKKSSPPGLQTREELLEKFYRMFHFTLEDLRWNRQGILSPSQRTSFERKIAWVLALLYIGSVVLLLALLALLVGILSAIIAKLLGSDGLNMVAGYMLAFGIFALFPGIGFTVYSRFVELPTREQLKKGVVSSIDGIISKRIETKEDSDGDSYNLYYYSICGLEYKVQENVYRMLPEGLLCRLYYLDPDPNPSMPEWKQGRPGSQLPQRTWKNLPPGVTPTENYIKVSIEPLEAA